MQLYDVVIIVMALLFPFAVIHAYRLGVTDRGKKDSGEPLIYKKPTAAVQTNQYLDDVLDNINNYNGDGKGQKEVKLER